MDNAAIIVRDLLTHADIVVNGNRPWDIVVHDERLYNRLLRDRALAMGEAYMDSWWDSDDLGETIRRILSADLEHAISIRRLILPALKAQLLNPQRKVRAAKDVSAHYDRGNALFSAMLDRRMTYSCAYWKDAGTLDAAQEAKLDLVCRKIGLREGERVLDLGCGWGSFMKYAAERYGAQAVGVTLSRQQVALGKELCDGLPVEFRLQDYRDLDEPFDHVVSLGMVEHVGAANYRRFMEVAARCLRDDGLFLLHSIGTRSSRVDRDSWSERYIFPGSHLPTATELVAAAGERFIIEDWHNIGVDYARTLDAWFDNFDAHWQGKLDRSYDERFYRMWKYFLKSSAGSFRARRNHVWQIVFSKSGVPGGYSTIR
ncbi:MAG: cyclopropane fatty acyl phospholipid synthase [Bacteroidota bacterium]|nr:cyclopropane fatty acyl phospholipid synthase [Bacteroidota bacterium]